MSAVPDPGGGMDAGVRANVLEPFFTTKEVGKGTGLGLATVYGIVKQSDGYISVYSEVGRGTSFKIYLPRIDTPAPIQASPAKDRPDRGTEPIPVVGDEPAVLSLSRRPLEAQGYAVAA